MRKKKKKKKKLGIVLGLDQFPLFPFSAHVWTSAQAGASRTFFPSVLTTWAPCFLPRSARIPPICNRERDDMIHFFFNFSSFFFLFFLVFFWVVLGLSSNLKHTFSSIFSPPFPSRPFLPQTGFFFFSSGGLCLRGSCLWFHVRDSEGA